MEKVFSRVVENKKESWVAAPHVSVFVKVFENDSYIITLSESPAAIELMLTEVYWLLLSLTDSTAEPRWSVLGASPYFMKAIWRTKALLGHVGTECGLWVSMAAALALAIKRMRGCFLWNQGLCSKKFRYLPSDRILGLAWQRLVPGFRGNAAKSCPFLYRVTLLFQWGYFKFFIACMLHFIGSGRLCDRLQRALMIQIDYFTTGSLGQALRLVEDAFQPCW